MDKDNIKLAYQSAVSLKSYEGSLVWSRFGVMLTINTIILSLVGLLISKSGFETEFSLWFILLSIFGLLFAVIWWQMTSRGFAMVTYYTLVAREAEDRLGNGIDIFTRGNKFRKNMTVEFDLKDKNDPLRNFQRPLHSRYIRTEKAAYLTIELISLVYLLIFVANLALLFLKR